MFKQFSREKDERLSPEKKREEKILEQEVKAKFKLKSKVSNTLQRRFNLE